ncbi:NADH-quinone oxidoreductase%2C D subunit NuoD [Mycobacteroides abscessus]|nr:NADH-quinone oxidoreductase%2C D subunit NuoD [Mycobacteroides abscessus]
MTAQPEIHLMAGGQDWDEIVTAAGQATDERIVSTWVRSIHPRTACCV